MKNPASLLALGLLSLSFPVFTQALAEEKTPTPPEFSYNFLNIPLSTAEPPTPVDMTPLPDLTQTANTAASTPKTQLKSEAIPAQQATPVSAPKQESSLPSAPVVVSEAQPIEAAGQDKATPVKTEEKPVDTTPAVTAVAVASPTLMTTVGTSFSALLNQPGDTVKVYLNTATVLPTGQMLPAGTQLKGKILSMPHNQKRQSQDMKIVFTQAAPPLSAPISIQATPDMPEGILTPGAEAIGLKETHSYESLKGKLVKTLGADQAVYNQRLNVNSSQLTDYRKDDFIQKFHKNAVLVGSGDQLRLKLMP